MIIIGLWGLMDAFSRSSLTCTRRIHHGLLHCTVENPNPNLKPGFEGVQTQNPGLEIVVWVWNPYWNRFTDLHEIFCADPLWPWLGPSLAALRYIMYFRLYG